MKFQCIIRSSNERTMPRLLRQAEELFGGPKSIVVLNETPFYRTLLECMRVGSNSTADWIVCLDGDLTLDIGRVKQLLKKLPAPGPRTFGYQPMFFDKFFLKPKYGAIHIYSQKSLKVALSLAEQIDIKNQHRPEATLIKAMRKNGYTYQVIDQLVCLHDFDQSEDDLYRKAFFHCFKSESTIGEIISNVRARFKDETDYEVIRRGVQDALNYSSFRYGQDSISIPKDLPKKGISFLESYEVSNLLLQADEILAKNLDSQSLKQKISRYFKQRKEKHNM